MPAGLEPDVEIKSFLAERLLQSLTAIALAGYV